MKKIELLIPVGNKEMLYYAIHNGADAIYLAGKNYGARKYSNNFTNEELIEAIKYSHLYGVLVYITVNTIIYNSEIEDFLNYIDFLNKNNIDALIMQDIGMIKLVHEKYPNITIHASTQCHTYNKEGIEFLKELGCSRIVFSRETSLDEIKKINTTLETEIFTYGALCVSYSGQCLFSSLNGGRSGNRGECVGSCRLPYKLVKNNKYLPTKGEYLLSTGDLNTIDKLKEIIESNITSIKIEGRMKSPYYVAYITKIYRTLIDKYYKGESINLTSEELINLKKLFNRKFTSGYLFKDNNIMNITSPNHIGIPIGEVIKYTNKNIYIKLTKDNLYLNDGIRFKNQNKGLIINKLYNKNYKLTNQVNKNNIAIIDNKISLNKNDIVLKTIDNKLIKEIKQTKEKKIPITFIAILEINKPFKLTITDKTNTITTYGDIIKPSINSEVTKENIKISLSKLGNTPYIIENIKIIKDKNIFINLKNLNQLRRELVAKLNKKRTNKNNISKSLPYYLSIPKINKKYNLNILVRNKEQLQCCIDNNIDNIYITDYNLYQQYKNINNIYYRIPRINNNNINFNNTNLLVTDTSSIYKYKDNNNLISDYYLNITNDYSIELLSKLNIKRITLSVELNKQQIKDLNKNYDLELIIYGRLELMLMKYCPLKYNLDYCKYCNSSQDKFYLENNKKEKFPIINNNCTTSIMHYKNINYIKDIEEYKKMNITSFRIELFDEDYNTVEKLIKQINKEGRNKH